MRSLHIPIVVMSFNRPDFLDETLQTLQRQDGFDPDDYDIHLFQDGSVNRWSGMQYAAQSDVEACIAVFKARFPKGEVHHPVDNIGICESFWSAENFVFDHLKADAAWFFEDDMILSPAYFQMMLMLDNFAKRTPKVSYYSAYGNYYASAKEVVENMKEIIPLDHHWAFGLRREAWLRMQPGLRGYYSLIRGRDYSRRDHRAVFEFYESSGFVPRGSSQDAAKTWVCARLGLVRIRTFAPYARYIGTKGAHMTPERFDQLGFSRTEILSHTIDDLKFPDGCALISAADEQRRALYDVYRLEYKKIREDLPSKKFNPLRMASSSDVVSAYLYLLHRLPRSEAVVKKHEGQTSVHHLVKEICASPEYMKLQDGSAKPRHLDPSRAIRNDELTNLYGLILHREPDASANLNGRSGVTSVSANVATLLGSDEYKKIDRLIAEGAATRRTMAG